MLSNFSWFPNRLQLFSTHVITFNKILFRVSDNFNQDQAWLPWVWYGSKNVSECWQISPLAGKELIVGKEAAVSIQNVLSRQGVINCKEVQGC